VVRVLWIIIGRIASTIIDIKPMRMGGMNTDTEEEEEEINNIEGGGSITTTIIIITITTMSKGRMVDTTTTITITTIKGIITTITRKGRMEEGINITIITATINNNNHHMAISTKIWMIRIQESGFLMTITITTIPIIRGDVEVIITIGTVTKPSLQVGKMVRSTPGSKGRGISMIKVEINRNIKTEEDTITTITTIKVGEMEASRKEEGITTTIEEEVEMEGGTITIRRKSQSYPFSRRRIFHL